MNTVLAAIAVSQVLSMPPVFLDAFGHVEAIKSSGLPHPGIVKALAHWQKSISDRITESSRLPDDERIEYLKALQAESDLHEHYADQLMMRK